MLGLGIGGYRDELEMVRPELARARRADVLDEGLAALRLLFDQPAATFEGRYVRFADVDLSPKPLQRPFPILLGANGPAGLRRVARYADGWVAASDSPDNVAAGRAQLDAALTERGRDPAPVETHIQTWLSFGRDDAEAEAKLRRSQHFRRIVAHQADPSESAALEHFRAGNLLGRPKDVVEQLRAFEQAGVTHLGVVILSDGLDDLLADMELFATEVMPAFDKQLA
jgi:alkanesulfonate monooxygenase SsuD/methylene tetrahydromethanopterin reductase-like flavin-dependent oxidoreductase (luciferase family)